MREIRQKEQRGAVDFSDSGMLSEHNSSLDSSVERFETLSRLFDEVLHFEGDKNLIRTPTQGLPGNDGTCQW